jgi:hypothetical protein
MPLQVSHMKYGAMYRACSPQVAQRGDFLARECSTFPTMTKAAAANKKDKIEKVILGS